MAMIECLACDVCEAMCKISFVHCWITFVDAVVRIADARAISYAHFQFFG